MLNESYDFNFLHINVSMAFLWIFYTFFSPLIVHISRTQDQWLCLPHLECYTADSHYRSSENGAPTKRIWYDCVKNYTFNMLIKLPVFYWIAKLTIPNEIDFLLFLHGHFVLDTEIYPIDGHTVVGETFMFVINTHLLLTLVSFFLNFFSLCQIALSNVFVK